MSLEDQHDKYAYKLKWELINYKLNHKTSCPWKTGRGFMIQLMIRLCALGFCVWFVVECIIEGDERAAGLICNTWRYRGLLVCFILDCWCRHNHGLEQPFEVYGFTYTDYNVIFLIVGYITVKSIRTKLK